MKTTQTPSDRACLVCGKKMATLKRGLCGAHYELYRRARQTLPEDQRADFEEQLIERGKLAKDARPANNPFANLAKEMLAKDRDQQRAELDRTHAEETAKKPARNRGKNSHSG